MKNRFERLLEKQERWISLEDIYDENNELIRDFRWLIEQFSNSTTVVFITLFQYGVLNGLVNHHVDENITLFPYSNSLDNIGKYLNEDGFIIIPTSERSSWLEDYPKEKKRKDFIHRINFVRPNYDVPFAIIKHINPTTFRGLKIDCKAKSKGKYNFNLDLIKDWDKFEDNDLLSITHEFIPLIYFED